MKKAVLGIVALSAFLTLGAAFAQDKTSTPIWVDSAGKELGPLGFSGSIGQGVVLNINGLWVLVPFGVNGVGYTVMPVAPAPAPNLLGEQLFFTTANCQGSDYILSPSRARLKKNSEQHPYSAFMGIGQAVLLPLGQPKLGTELGIVATLVVTPLAGVNPVIGPCLPALAAPGEYFVPFEVAGLSSSVLQEEGFQPPPYSLIMP